MLSTGEWVGHIQEKFKQTMIKVLYFFSWKWNKIKSEKKNENEKGERRLREERKGRKKTRVTRMAVSNKERKKEKKRTAANEPAAQRYPSSLRAFPSACRRFGRLCKNNGERRTTAQA